MSLTGGPFCFTALVGTKIKFLRYSPGSKAYMQWFGCKEIDELSS